MRKSFSQREKELKSILKEKKVIINLKDRKYLINVTQAAISSEIKKGAEGRSSNKKYKTIELFEKRIKEILRMDVETIEYIDFEIPKGTLFTMTKEESDNKTELDEYIELKDDIMTKIAEFKDDLEFVDKEIDRLSNHKNINLETLKTKYKK